MDDEHLGTYVDRPKPGRGYLAAAAGIVVAILVFAAIGAAEIDRQPDPPGAWFLVLFVVVGCGIVALVLHAAYHTEYTIDDRALHIRWGMLQKHSVRLNDIRRVERINFLHGDMTLNRLTYGIRIRLSGEIWFSKGMAVSPSDIDEFVRELEARAGRKLLR